MNRYAADKRERERNRGREEGRERERNRGREKGRDRERQGEKWRARTDVVKVIYTSPFTDTNHTAFQQ